MPPVTRTLPGPVRAARLDVVITRSTVGVSTPAAREAPLRAPDGMLINRPSSRPVAGLDRTAVIEAAKKAGVPQRVQIGPTCGLYALGMVMDHWHEKNPANPTVQVQGQDKSGKGKNYNFAPTDDELMLDYAKSAGFTSQGEMFTASQLGQTAAHFGYQANVHPDATLDDLYNVLDKGHPAIVAFDVDYNGNPADYGGMRAHYAVIEGYFDQDGERFLVARHGWGVQKDHVWKASDFDRSWKALKATDYYGTPGDGRIPKEPGLREPALLDLPDVGGGKAGIFESLGTKIVEVVPHGEIAAGGEAVAAPG